jgi:hypothetical protein
VLTAVICSRQQPLCNAYVEERARKTAEKLGKLYAGHIGELNLPSRRIPVCNAEKHLLGL